MPAEPPVPNMSKYTVLRRRLENEIELFTDWYKEQLKDTQPVDRNHNARRIESVALVGVCFAFIYALMTTQKFNLALHIALVAFAIAVPSLLANYALAANLRPKSGANRTIIQAFWEMGTILGIGVGGIATAVGVLAAIWNLYPPAMWVMLGWAAAITILIPLLAVWRFARSQHGVAAKSYRSALSHASPPDSIPD